jgi:hypothetical protein
MLKLFNEIKKEVRTANPEATSYIINEVAKVVYADFKNAKKTSKKLTQSQKIELALSKHKAGDYSNSQLMQILKEFDLKGGMAFNKIRWALTNKTKRESQEEAYENALNNKSGALKLFFNAYNGLKEINSGDFLVSRQSKVSKESLVSQYAKNLLDKGFMVEGDQYYNLILKFA